MALKFRRRQKLFPGVYLNLSKSGISTTIGMKGMSLNIGKSGVYLNTGIPGTGIYDRKKLGSSQLNKTKIRTDLSPNYFIPPSMEGEIKSKAADYVTSRSLEGMKETFLAAVKEKMEIQVEIDKIHRSVKRAKAIKILAKIFLFGFITSHFNEKHAEIEAYLSDLKAQLDNCKVSIEVAMDELTAINYYNLKTAFLNLSTCEKIWDQISTVKNNDNRSTANATISRELTKIYEDKIPFLNAQQTGLCFENRNGSNINLYPGFIVMFNNQNSFGLIALSDLKISFETIGFLETQIIPRDAKVIGENWAKANKDGSPDKRFVGNYKIPIVEYGLLKFKTNTGVNEVFIFSDISKTEIFYQAFKNFCES